MLRPNVRFFITKEYLSRSSKELWTTKRCGQCAFAHNSLVLSHKGAQRIWFGRDSASQQCGACMMIVWRWWERLVVSSGRVACENRREVAREGIGLRVHIATRSLYKFARARFQSLLAGDVGM